MTLTAFFLDGARLRLATPTDPRAMLLSDDTPVIQEVQEMIRAAVQAEIGKLHAFLGPLGSTPEGIPAPQAALAAGRGSAAAFLEGEDDAALPAPEAPAPLPQAAPQAAPYAPAAPPPPAAGMKWCQKRLHQYPATRSACRQCATLRQQKHRANKARKKGGAIPAL